MRILTLAVSLLIVKSLALGAPACTTAPLTTYLNSGSFFSCSESSGNLNVEFNHDILPSYVGLNLLSTNNNAALPSAITVVPGNPGLDFESSAFTENSILLGSQAELVHFLLNSGTQSITSTTLSLDHVSINGGLGAAVAIGQELLCVGGTFTSLPTGLVTSVLGQGAFGCNGVFLSGTAAVSAGLLTDITGTLGLPDLTGLSDTATIQLSPVNQHTVDVIKLQALVDVGIGASVSDTGFGNTYTLSGSATAPEPGSWMLMVAAGLVLAGNRVIGKLLGLGRIKGGSVLG
jgi:hypothetical protein